MKRLLRPARVAALLAVALATRTSDLSAASSTNALPEHQAVATALGATTSAITYWAREPNGWHVVTTIDTVIGRGGEAERHAVVRFSAVLQPGQSQLISVPTAIGERQQTLRVRRVGDRIEVASVADGV
ncbi:MAG TPA: hypothetical protein VMH36_05280 [Alphaproteobacteria bacterium]|nr:hypothetical protein [Alphaproteobacteria bacterium]